MPRQLPWAKKSGGSRAQIKPASSQQTTKSHNATDTDDGFFDDTVLASRTGRSDESDDDLPGLPAEPSTPRTKARAKDALRKKREGSSSPPPVNDLEQPFVEGMHRAASKFDLRDDDAGRAVVDVVELAAQVSGGVMLRCLANGVGQLRIEGLGG